MVLAHSRVDVNADRGSVLQIQPRLSSWFCAHLIDGVPCHMLSHSTLPFEGIFKLLFDSGIRRCHALSD